MRSVLLALLLAGCVGPKKQAQAAAKVDLGEAYLREGNAAGAISELRKATKLDPRNAEAWERLALGYMARGAWEEAEGAFKRALRLTPNSAQVLNNYGLFLLHRDRVGEAIDAFEKALKDLEYRKPAFVLNNLGYALYTDGQFEAAVLRLNEAVKRMPSLCQARFHRGLSYAALHRLDQALEDFDAVIHLCGEEAPGAWYHAAEVLIAQGNREMARTYLQSVLQLTPEDQPLAAAARDMLLREAL